MRQDSFVHDLRGHLQEVSAIRWSPIQTSLLASESRDSTVRIWDVEVGQTISTFDGHRDSVVAVDFSPTADYVASGSGDKYVHIWSVKHQKLVKSFYSNGSVSGVGWNHNGNKIACSLSNCASCVLDFRV